MSDRVQPGVKIDARLWEQFRNEVKQRSGGIRGHVRSELETALRLYIADESEVSAVQVNRRLGRIESELGIASADGGADTLGAESHTHAPSGYDPETDGKPSANASTDKKVAYLAAQIEADVGENFEEITRTKLKDTVKDEYGFRKDTAKRYVERLVDHFDLVDHPTIDPLLVTQAKRETIIEQRREELETEADAELDEVTDR